MVSISARVSPRAPANSPYPATGFQGGMYPLAVTLAIDNDRFAVSP